MKDVSLLRKYEFMVIWRQAMIMMIAAPVPAAVIKLQGMLLDSQGIAIIMIIVNMFTVSSYLFNKYCSIKALFIIGNGLSFIAVCGILLLYYLKVDNRWIIIYYPIVSGLAFMLVGIASSKIKNSLKEMYGDAFNTSNYDTKKASVVSGAMLLGQGLALGFYTLPIDINPIFILLTLETVNFLIYGYCETLRWKLVCKMGIK